jgi:hypothetical protein
MHTARRLTSTKNSKLVHTTSSDSNSVLASFFGCNAPSISAGGCAHAYSAHLVG